jgi:hypothetical protein
MTSVEWRNTVAGREAITDFRAHTSRHTPTEKPVYNPDAEDQAMGILAGLSERQREVAQLHGMAGLSFPEIARMLGLDRSTIRHTWWRVIENATGVTPEPLERKRETRRERYAAKPKREPLARPKADRKPPGPRPGPWKVTPEHGTNSRYTNQRCRCPLCTDAHRVAQADYARRRKNP